VTVRCTSVTARCNAVTREASRACCGHAARSSNDESHRVIRETIAFIERHLRAASK
jgi:hypothetical protein